MAYLTKRAMRERGNRLLQEQRQKFAKSERQVLNEAIRFDPTTTYDVFLSHCSRDKPLVLGVKERLEEDGLLVYVDWIEDADMDRTEVTTENASRLRRRLRNCRSLLYLVTENAVRSKWMPWELGYFDGLDKGLIGILPVLDDAEEQFDGIEFLGLYSTIDVRQTKAGTRRFFVSRADGTSTSLRLIIRDS